MIQGRLTESADAGASVLCVSCPHTRMQADWAYQTTPALGRRDFVSDVVMYPQLLGLSLGIDAGELGWSAAPDWAPQT
jgi:heterodisulfide reductase subunit B